jgi:hypothetical protein
MMCHKMKGLFCANFAASRLSWAPCRNVWHGRCYTPHPLDSFYHHRLTDGDGFDWQLPEDESRFQVTRDGDNLLTVFSATLVVSETYSCGIHCLTMLRMIF